MRERERTGWLVKKGGDKIIFHMSDLHIFLRIKMIIYEYNKNYIFRLQLHFVQMEHFVVPSVVLGVFVT